jgi:hypothetical protein
LLFFLRRVGEEERPDCPLTGVDLNARQLGNIKKLNSPKILVTQYNQSLRVAGGITEGRE